jgi:rRNA biogenesis protein RRP5
LQEKYNVWVAMINLEHKYGTDRTLQEVFKRAVTESKVQTISPLDPTHPCLPPLVSQSKYIHLQLAELYATSGDLEGARRMFETAVKKHKTSKKVPLLLPSISFLILSNRFG